MLKGTEARNFLVPLDGSHLAEAVLPATIALAGRSQGVVILLHIIERHAPTTIHGQRHLTNVEEAGQYLEKVAVGLHAEGVKVTCHVHEDKEQDIARSIFEHARELNCELLIMCTHGNGGIREMFTGSIAQKVLQRGMQSILLIFPHEDGSAPPFEPKRILVPLDGTSAHEQALPVAIELVRTFHAEMHLVLVIPTLTTLSGGQAVTGKLLPTTMRAVLDLTEQDSTDYLRRIVAECYEKGISASAEVLRGDAVPVVLGLAKRLDIDLIVMVSHGRVGIEAVLARSVAPRIAGRMERALLLIHADTMHGETALDTSTGSSR